MIELTEMKKLWFFHSSFVLSRVHDIYHDDPISFIKALKNYYVTNKLDAEEMVRVLNTKAQNGMVSESIMMYLDIHIRELVYAYKRFGSSEIPIQTKRWSKIRDALQCYIDQNS